MSILGGDSPRNTLAGTGAVMAGSPKPPSEMSQAVGIQSAALKHLLGRIGSLSEKLQPVLDLRERPEDPKPLERVEPRPYASLLANDIASNTSEVDSAIKNVEILIDRLTI